MLFTFTWSPSDRTLKRGMIRNWLCFALPALSSAIIFLCIHIWESEISPCSRTTSTNLAKTYALSVMLLDVVLMRMYRLVYTWRNWIIHADSISSAERRNVWGQQEKKKFTPLQKKKKSSPQFFDRKEQFCSAGAFALRYCPVSLPRLVSTYIHTYVHTYIYIHIHINSRV